MLNGGPTSCSTALTKVISCHNSQPIKKTLMAIRCTLVMNPQAGCDLKESSWRRRYAVFGSKTGLAFQKNKRERVC